jgi:hypothetical protein
MRTVEKGLTLHRYWDRASCGSWSSATDLRAWAWAWA